MVLWFLFRCMLFFFECIFIWFFQVLLCGWMCVFRLMLLCRQMWWLDCGGSYGCISVSGSVLLCIIRFLCGQLVCVYSVLLLVVVRQVLDRVQVLLLIVNVVGVCSVQVLFFIGVMCSDVSLLCYCVFCWCMLFCSLIVFILLWVCVVRCRLDILFCVLMFSCFSSMFVLICWFCIVSVLLLLCYGRWFLMFIFLVLQLFQLRLLLIRLVVMFGVLCGFFICIWLCRLLLVFGSRLFNCSGLKCVLMLRWLLILFDVIIWLLFNVSFRLFWFCVFCSVNLFCVLRLCWCSMFFSEGRFIVVFSVFVVFGVVLVGGGSWWFLEVRLLDRWLFQFGMKQLGLKFFSVVLVFQFSRGVYVIWFFICSWLLGVCVCSWWIDVVWLLLCILKCSCVFCFLCLILVWLIVVQVFRVLVRLKCVFFRVIGIGVLLVVFGLGVGIQVRLCVIIEKLSFCWFCWLKLVVFFRWVLLLRFFSSSGEIFSIWFCSDIIDGVSFSF